AWNHQLEPLGITIELLRAQPDHSLRITTQHQDKKYTEGGFQTQTRRIELYSEQLLRHGYAPLPCDRPQKDALTEKQVKRYPLTLTSAKSGYYRSEEHTSELQSRFDLVCRLLLEKKKIRQQHLFN